MRLVYFLPSAALAFVGQHKVLPRAAPQRAVDVSSLDISSLDPTVIGGVVAAVGAAAVLWCSAGLLRRTSAGERLRWAAGGRRRKSEMCLSAPVFRNSAKRLPKVCRAKPPSMLQDASFGFCSH